jgi:hypothetical protein
MRRTVANWYTSKSEGWRHQDVGPASLKDNGARLAMTFAITGPETARLIREHGLVREHLPTALLDSIEMWKAQLLRSISGFNLRRIKVMRYA